SRRACEKCLGDDVLALIRGCGGEFGEPFGSPFLPCEWYRSGTNQAPRSWFRNDTEGSLDPTGDWVCGELIETFHHPAGAWSEHCTQCRDIDRVRFVNWFGRSLERLANDVG